MRNRRHPFVGMFISGMVGLVGLVAGPAGANHQPNHGGVKTCESQLATCTASLGTCNSDLTLCEGELSTCQEQAVCGDGVVAGEEECDVGTLGGATCASEGFAGGVLTCGTGCTLDTSECYASRFEDTGLTIIDNETGLEWEKKTDDNSVHDKDNTYNWNTTGIGTSPNGTVFTDFLGTLNDCQSSDGTTVTGGFAGHCDWRLPTFAELQSIVDRSVPGCGVFGGTTPCIPAIFGLIGELFYWSSISFAPDPEAAWALYFPSPDLLIPAEKDQIYHARAVRGAR